jgi:GntR family transcriptional regulator/MocR family aminotransferase
VAPNIGEWNRIPVGDSSAIVPFGPEQYLWIYPGRYDYETIVTFGQTGLRIMKAAQMEITPDRSSFPLAVSNIVISIGSPTPIYTQICSAIRSAIVRGELPAGTLMPTSRELAVALGVGRNTVISAYSRLGAEGYLESKFRRGTRVTARLSLQNAGQSAPAEPADVSVAPNAEAPIEIAYSIERTLRQSSDNKGDSRPFSPFAPDATLFPRVHFSRLLSEECGRVPLAETGFDMGAELKRFQTAVAAHIRRTNGIVCAPAQIIPTIGAESAVDLVARLIVDPGHVVQIEEPSWEVPRAIFRSAGARLFDIPSDSQGAIPQRAAGPPARLICVSPSVSFPLGVQMPATRRQAIVEHASASGALIFENDCYGELLFAGARLQAIQALQPGRVIYFGSFHSSLGPKIRIGYLVVPEAFVEPVTKLCRIVAPGPDQMVLSALATFLETGQYAVHAKKLRAIYSERMARLAEICRDRMPEAEIVEPCGGIHLTLMLPPEIPAALVCRLANRYNIGIVPLDRFCAGARKANGVVLGIGMWQDRHADQLASKIAEFVHEAAAKEVVSLTAAE